MKSALPLLEIEGLTHFFGGLAALTDFQTRLYDQELVGLIGPNGAGKTTVFNLVCGLYRPGAGAVQFNGTRLNGKYPHQITSLGIGRTFQNIRLWNELSVLDNLRIAHFSQMKYGILDAFFLTPKLRNAERQVTAEAMELLRLFNLEAYADDRPRNLSYGVQRRVEIGRALVMKPRLLLLDEPAAGMNQSEISELMELIQWVREQFQVTVWIIEHQMRVIMGICERIQVLDFGRIIAEGTPEEIRHHPRVIEAYLGDEPRSAVSVNDEPSLLVHTAGEPHFSLGADNAPPRTSLGNDETPRTSLRNDETPRTSLRNDEEAN